MKRLLTRFGAKFEQLMDNDHLMSGLVGVLLVAVIIVTIVAIIGLIFFGGSSACPDGYREIRELQYFIDVNDVQVPVYEVTGCVQ